MKQITCIKRFIRNGINKALDERIISQFVWGVGFFNLIEILYAFLSYFTENKPTLFLGIIIILMWISFFIFSKIMIRKECYKNDFLFLYSSGRYIYLTLTSFLALIMAMILLNAPIIIYFVLIIICFMPITIYYLIIIHSIKKRTYRKIKRKVKPVNTALMTTFAILGSLWVSNHENPLENLPETVVITIMIVTLLFLTIVLSFGLINILRYYYIKKYSLKILR